MRVILTGILIFIFLVGAALANTESEKNVKIQLSNTISKISITKDCYLIASTIKSALNSSGSSQKWFNGNGFVVIAVNSNSGETYTSPIHHSQTGFSPAFKKIDLDKNGIEELLVEYHDGAYSDFVSVFQIDAINCIFTEASGASIQSGKLPLRYKDQGSHYEIIGGDYFPETYIKGDIESSNEIVFGWEVFINKYIFKKNKIILISRENKTVEQLPKWP